MSRPSVESRHDLDASPDPDTLGEVAWAKIEDALHTGVLVLGNGEQRVVDTVTLMNLVRWLAAGSYLRRSRQLTTLPEAFQVSRAREPV